MKHRVACVYLLGKLDPGLVIQIQEKINQDKLKDFSKKKCIIFNFNGLG